MVLHIERVSCETAGPRLDGLLSRLACLRIEVFRDFPYLYDGSEDYERRYLERLASGRDALLVLACEGERVVGGATGSALATQHVEFVDPMRAAGYPLERTFYCGESVLLPPYRGLGLGHAFFDQREAHAREHGYTHACFCAVMRPPDHPLRPANYRPLEAFWRRRGYRPLPGVIAHFGWKDLGETAESEKPMQFWARPL